jgi:hypothetical protein
MQLVDVRLVEVEAIPSVEDAAAAESAKLEVQLIIKQKKLKQLMESALFVVVQAVKSVEAVVELVGNKGGFGIMYKISKRKLFMCKSLKYIMFLTMAIFLFSCSGKEKAIPEVALGYDIVKWGDSVEAVKTAYNMRDSFSSGTAKNDTNIFMLQQNNASETINRRIFYFIEDKLYRVLTVYSDISYSDILNALTQKYGKPEHTSETEFLTSPSFGNVPSQGYEQTDQHDTFTGYSPNIEVDLRRLTLKNSNMGFIMQDDLGVTYVWKQFEDDYITRKVKF